MSSNECVRLLREVLKRLEVIEGELDMLREEIEELRGTRVETPREGSVGSSLIRIINERLFMDTKEVMSKGLLKRLVDSGKVIILRDEGANREVVTTKEIVRKLLSKLPLSPSDAARLSDREYELLQILNRLGYVLLRDGKYVPSEEAKEFI
ncbi:hypothetical protein [Vulcanisaeta thermophila]|uniref:hypothetical protein n=1 Tax=Vulcanisaeta thermophila TaxID=867917 RepID=UPI0008537BFF|nr:hypothetical protein [Vulcanisaeta thermophila]